MKHILAILVVALLFGQPPAFAETKEIVAEGTYNMGDGETPTVAESRALLQAKRTAVEEAGTYVESYSKTRNFQLTVDEIQVLASGIMEVEVLEKKRTVVGDGFNFWIKIKARVSTDKMEEMAKRVKEKSVVEDYKKIQAAYDKSQKDIEELKRQLAGAKGEKEKKRVEAKIADDDKRFRVEKWIEEGYQSNFYKDTDEAIKGYTNALALEPDNYDAIVSLGNIYYDTEQAEKAIEFYRKALKINPNDANVRTDLGTMYRNTGNIDKAIEMLKKALSIDPEHEQALYNLGVVLYQDKKDMDGAADAWEQLLKTNPNYSFANPNYSSADELKQIIQQIYYVAASNNYSKGQYDKAIVDYSKAIAIEPNDVKAYYNRGLAYNSKGQYDRAIEDFNEAIALNPNLAEAFTLRGLAYVRKGQYDKAIEDYSKAIALNPNFGGAYIARGLIYGVKEQYDKAIEDYNKAIVSSDPSDITAYYYRGLTYQKKGLYNKAVEDFDKVIAINPDNAEIYNSRGFAHHLLGNYKQAINDYNKAIKMNPKDTSALSNRGLVYAKMGNNENALKDK